MIAYGKEIKISLVDQIGADGEYDSIELFYEEDGKWVYLAGENFFLINGDLSTKEKTDEFFNASLEKFNKALFEKFGKAQGAEPEHGIERLQWLLSRTIVENNTLKLK